MAYNWSFDLIPVGGDLSGFPGQELTWGYTIVNNDSLWLNLVGLDAGIWEYGTPMDVFDYPTVVPGGTVTGNLYQFTLDNDAPAELVNSGTFTLTGDWYDSEPLIDGNYISTEYKTSLYSSSVVPEPATFVLLGAGLLGLFRFKKSRIFS